MTRIHNSHGFASQADSHESDTHSHRPISESINTESNKPMFGGLRAIIPQVRTCSGAAELGKKLSSSSIVPCTTCIPRQRLPEETKSADSVKRGGSMFYETSLHVSHVECSALVSDLRFTTVYSWALVTGISDGH